MSWTDEMVSLLKDLWPTGKAAGEIASMIGGGKSRQAVIGKAYRLKLGQHPNAGEWHGNSRCAIGRPKKTVKPKVERRAAPRRPFIFSMKPNRKRTELVEATDLAPEPEGSFEPRWVPLLDLPDGEGACRFPNANLFCAHPRAPGSRACEYHLPRMVSRVAKGL